MGDGEWYSHDNAHTTRSCGTSSRAVLHTPCATVTARTHHVQRQRLCTGDSDNLHTPRTATAAVHTPWVTTTAGTHHVQRHSLWSCATHTTGDSDSSHIPRTATLALQLCHTHDGRQRHHAHSTYAFCLRHSLWSCATPTMASATALSAAACSVWVWVLCKRVRAGPEWS